MITPLLPHLPALHDTLAQHLSWLSHDFITHNATFLQASRQQHATLLTREIAVEDDLRVLHEGDEGEIALFAEVLRWDSAFFGYPIARLHGAFFTQSPISPHDGNLEPALKAFVAYARQQGVRYLIASVFPEDLALIRAMSASGFTLIETRATYHRSLIDYAYPERFAVRPATPHDVDLLAKTAVSMVNPYDRFHADPFISEQEVARLMTEWVTNSVLNGFADITLVPDVHSPKALSTVKYHRDQWQAWGVALSQLVLGAVSPEFKGWYSKLTSEICYHLQGIGAEHIFIVTQNTNRAAIHSWEKLGFRYGRGEHIFRIIL